MILLLLFGLVSRVSTKHILGISGILICLSNRHTFEIVISSFEFAVGGARYTNFLMAYLDRFDEASISIGFALLLAWILANWKNPEQFIDKKHVMKMKTSLLIMIFAILVYKLGVSIEYSLRLINLTLLPILSLILTYKKVGSYPLVLLSMYFVLTMNITLKHVA
jgi:hypothetical protein